MTPAILFLFSYHVIHLVGVAFFFFIRLKKGKRTSERKILKKTLMKRRREKRRKAKLANHSKGQPERKINIQ